MKILSYTLIAGSMLLMATSLSSSASDSVNRYSRSKDFAAAKELYDHSMFQKAREEFRAIDNESHDVLSCGYAVLCSIHMKSEHYRDEMKLYLIQYPYSILLPTIRYAYALNLFDEGEFTEARKEFFAIDEKDLPRKERINYNFKKAYCCFEEKDYRTAKRIFTDVEKTGSVDYAAPSRYALGYINYEQEHFAMASDWFEKASKDPRFRDISAYYILECQFMLKNYDYVIENGPEAFDIVPEDRKASLGRLLSESYLVEGDAANAKKVYDEYLSYAIEDTDDYFYAGSLLYAIGDYRGAVDKFEAMTDKTDSLGQIANYQLAHSYLEIKNKVSAMEAFKDASEAAYDPVLTEDAFFNYAKLAFDLNRDASVYERYLKAYPNCGKDEMIYSYIAMAALLRKDYSGAIDAYDHIDELDEDQVANYMKANYLRAAELINSQAWSAAVVPLKTAGYYADKKGRLAQLSKFWLAESYYRTDKISDAKKLYTELYNASALYGREEYSLITLGLAYCYYKENDITNAIKWFQKYVDFGNVTFAKTAQERIGDCYFYQKDYKSARAAYDVVLAKYADPDDVYPYYRAGVCSGLLSDNASKIKYLSRVLDARPSAPLYSDALFELGQAYANAGNNTSATNCFNTLISQGTDKTYVAASYIELAMMARNSKDNNKALSYYKIVVEQMPDSELADDALLAIESIYQSQGNAQGYFAYLDSIGKGTTKTAEQREAIVFNSAEQIFLARNYDKALEALKDYQKSYPNGAALTKSDYYIAECYKFLDQKEKAFEYYRKVMNVGGDGSYVELATLNCANIAYGLQKYDEAYVAFENLSETAIIDENRFTGLVGMMRSAYKGEQYDKAASAAEVVAADSRSDVDVVREARYIDAKSLMARSNRRKALEIFTILAKDPKTVEGAEAAYILVQDAFDRGDFEDVENRVYDLADSNSPQAYWLARSYIVLGDSFAEQQQYNNAKAIFESIIDGYKPSAADDDVIVEVNMRLDAIAKMINK